MAIATELKQTGTICPCPVKEMAERPRDTRAQQSAEREDQMRDRFGLVPGGQGRPGVDALFPAGPGLDVPFEVKSSDTDSVSTARDVGREHIVKWRNRHWLFGFYKRGSRNPPIAIRYIYASPRQLESWIAEQEAYVLPDWELVRLLPPSVDAKLLVAVAGEKAHYTLHDAQRIFKSQKLESGEHMTPTMRALLLEAGLNEPRSMSKTVYRALTDIKPGFSKLAFRALIARVKGSMEEERLSAAFGETDFYPLDAVTVFLSRRRLSDGRHVSAKLLLSECDRQEGFSPDRMLALLGERVRYLLDRGATRNNPHIPERRLLGLVPPDQVIPPDAGRWAQLLEVLVRRELNNASAIDRATE